MAEEYGNYEDQGLAALIAATSAGASGGGESAPQQMQVTGMDEQGNAVYGMGPAVATQDMSLDANAPVFGMRDTYAPDQEEAFLRDLRTSFDGGSAVGNASDSGDGGGWRPQYAPEEASPLTYEEAVDAYKNMDAATLRKDPEMARNLAMASGYFDKEGGFGPSSTNVTADNLKSFVAQQKLDDASKDRNMNRWRAAIGIATGGAFAAGAMGAGAAAGAGTGTGTVAGNGASMGAMTSAEAAAQGGTFAQQFGGYAAGTEGLGSGAGLASLGGEGGAGAITGGEAGSTIGGASGGMTDGAAMETAMTTANTGGAGSGGIGSFLSSKAGQQALVKLAPLLLSALGGKGKQTLGGEGGRGWYYRGGEGGGGEGGGGGGGGGGGETAAPGAGKTNYSAVAKIPAMVGERTSRATDITDYLRNGAHGKKYFSDGGEVSSFDDMLAQAHAGLDTVYYAGGGQVGNVPELQGNGFVIPADVLAHLGNGNNGAGAEVLNQWLQSHGSKHGAHYLDGQTDGMADELATNIDGTQPAALSDGEAVITPEDVERVGGAAVLRKLMADVRKARTGTNKQAPRIDPMQFMSGGGIMQFAGGDGIPAIGPSQSWGGSGSSNSSTSSSGMADWAQPYVSNMLGKAWGLSETPYQAYTGQLTAGASDLQQKAFAGAGDLTVPQGFADASASAAQIGQKAGNMSYDPREQTFGTAQAQQYMNPYLQASLDPQLAEARRQSQISGLQDNARLTQAGAFGGSRQAIMDSERQRNLGTNMANITGQGYNTAYNNAQSQFNADRTSNNQDRQFGAQYGLSALNTQMDAAKTQGQMAQYQQNAGLANLNAQATLGGVQRGITSEGLAADKAQFDEEKNDPFKKTAYMQGMLQGLPLTQSNSSSTGSSGSSQGSIGAWGSIGDMGQPALSGAEQGIQAAGILGSAWNAYNSGS